MSKNAIREKPKHAFDQIIVKIGGDLAPEIESIEAVSRYW